MRDPGYSSYQTDPRLQPPAGCRHDATILIDDESLPHYGEWVCLDCDEVIG